MVLLFCSEFIVNVIQKIPPSRLVQSKRQCIKDLVNSKLFHLSKCRAILLPVFCQQIKDKLDNNEEVSGSGTARHIRVCMLWMFYNIAIVHDYITPLCLQHVILMCVMCVVCVCVCVCVSVVVMCLFFVVAVVVDLPHIHSKCFRTLHEPNHHQHASSHHHHHHTNIQRSLS